MSKECASINGALFTITIVNDIQSCAPRSHMDRITAARGANVCFRFDLVKLRRCCTLRRRLAATIIIIYYYMYILNLK